MPPPVLICDFDGTLTTLDVGDELCERFADPSWRDVDRAWLRGEISLPEAQSRMWALVRATAAQLVDHAHEVGRLRPGAEALFEAAARGEIELVIASGGFDLYIDALLGERRAHLTAAYHNRLVPCASGVEPVFLEGMGCTRCAVCKARVIELHIRPGRTVAFCGDGSSDRCAAAAPVELFAVTEGALDRHCVAQGIARTPFDDFDSVLERLRRVASTSRAG